MAAVKDLPENYRLAAGFSAKNTRSLLVMNLIGVGLLILSGWFYIVLAVRLRPAEAASFFTFNYEGVGALVTIGAALAILFVTITLHEAVHGLGFILLARVRPVFAFRGAYAYAAAPEWYIPRNPYLVIGLAPFVLLSLAGAGLIAVVPASWVAPLVLACVTNASGAVGDLWVAVLLLRQPVSALARDQGDEIGIYIPAKESSTFVDNSD
jgi:hypothetical protein